MLPTYSYDQLESRIAKWAPTQPVVRAIVVVGSRAKMQPAANMWFDLDLILLTHQPTDAATVTNWLSVFDDLWFVAHEPVQRPDWIALVAVFAPGLKVDLVVTPLSAASAPDTDLGQLLALAPYPAVFAAGLRVLHDQYHSTTVLQFPSMALYQVSLLSEAELSNLANRCWAQIIHVAQLLRRGYLWPAYQAVSCDLRHKLLMLVEQHARVSNGPNHPIQPRGRAIQAWADQRIVAMFPECAGAYTLDSLWHAVLTMSHLVHWLVDEIALGLGYNTPSESDREILTWLHEVASEASA